MRRVERDSANGLWVPCHYGNRFKVCRLLKDRRRTQETGPRKFKTLAEAVAECDRRNRKR